MTCERAKNALLALDHGSLPSIELSAHLAGCAACRREAERLGIAEDALFRSTDLPADRALTEVIMSRILLDKPDWLPGSSPSVPLVVCVLVGVMLIAGLLASSISGPLSWIAQEFGSSYQVPLNLILGGVLTVYLMLFIGSHLKELSTWFGIKASGTKTPIGPVR